MAIKPEEYSYSGVTTPCGEAEEITPADTDLDKITRAIYIGGAGDLTVLMAGNNEVVTFVGVAAGAYYPLRVKQIMAATTATDIVAMF